LAVGAGVAAVAVGKKYKTAETKKKKIMTHFIIQVNIAIQNVENMRKTVREFIIQTVTMKHLHVQESRKA
jgi:hypothetical protein